MKKVKEFIGVALQQFHDLAPGPEIKAMMDEIVEAETKIEELGKALDDSVGRVIEMNDKIEGLELALVRNQERLGVMYKEQHRYRERIEAMKAQLFAAESAVKEMGEKIDADAALVVSLREMPFMCFADDPHAALAAIVKADVDGAPVDWSKWPVVV